MNCKGGKCKSCSKHLAAMLGSYCMQVVGTSLYTTTLGLRDSVSSIHGRNELKVEESKHWRAQYHIQIYMLYVYIHIMSEVYSYYIQ